MHPLPRPLGKNGCGGFEEDCMLHDTSLGKTHIGDNWRLTLWYLAFGSTAVHSFPSVSCRFVVSLIQSLYI